MCRFCDWEDTLHKAKELLNDSDFAFAYDTLEGIAEWIENSEHCTERQAETIENIANSVYGRQDAR